MIILNFVEPHSLVMKLLEPFNIGDVEVRNRVVMSPMISNLGTPQGYPSEEHIAYLSRRAISAGLIITEYTYVNRRDARGSPNQLGLYDDEVVPKFSRLVDAVHGRGQRSSYNWFTWEGKPEEVSSGERAHSSLTDSHHGSC